MVAPSPSITYSGGGSERVATSVVLGLLAVIGGMFVGAVRQRRSIR